MPRKGTQRKRNASQAKSAKKKGWFARLRARMTGWTWWTACAIMVAVYVWAFYYFFVSPSGFRWKTMYGSVNNPMGYNIHGIDISHHQGHIDWELLSNRATIDECPVRFVMIKATEGSNCVDPMFDYNFTKAHEYGFTRGAYHFFSTLSTAKEQAAYFISKVNLQTGDLPPVLDVEVKPNSQSKESFGRSVLEWLRIVEQHYGVKPILYTSFRYRLDYLNDSVFNQYPYWIAHYNVDSVTYEGPWTFWQHTDRGRLPGIKGDVDFDIYNGSFYALRRMTIGHTQEP